MKKSLILILIVSSTSIVEAQEKGYYLGHHAASLQLSAKMVGMQANYHYIFNPKATLMWMGKFGLGYNPYEPSPFYYNAGIDLAIGGKNRLIVGVGAYYNAAYVGSRILVGDLGYLFLGKNNLFFSIIPRINYYPYCECTNVKPFDFDLLFSLGWKF